MDFRGCHSKVYRGVQDPGSIEAGALTEYGGAYMMSNTIFFFGGGSL